MRDARGFTLIELLLVIAIVAVLLSISMLFYRNARLRGGEAAAVGALDAINQAQFAYMQTCGGQQYAPTLASLGTPVPGTGTAFLSPDLTTGEELLKSGYALKMSGTAVTDGTLTCNGATPMLSYQVTADPAVPGLTGARYFGTNTDRVIFEDVETFVGRMPEKGPPEKGKEIQAFGRR